MTILLFLSLLLGSTCILSGYFRFISNDNGHLKLAQYHFVDSLSFVANGLINGTQNLLRFKLSKDAISSLMVYGGCMFYCAGFVVDPLV